MSVKLLNHVPMVAGDLFKGVFSEGVFFVTKGTSYELELMILADDVAEGDSSIDDINDAVEADFELFREGGLRVTLDPSNMSYIVPRDCLLAWRVVSASADAKLTVQNNV